MARDWRFWKREQRTVDPDLKGIVPWLQNIVPDTASGAAISQESSMNFPPVLQAVSLKSSLIGSFPKEVFEINGDEKKKSTGSLWKLLAFKPNSYQNAFTFWELQDVYLELWGNAYSLITRRGGEAVALNPIHPKYVEVNVDDNGKIVYRVSGTNSEMDGEYKMRDILHFKDLSFDGIKGRSRISMAKESIGLGVSAEKFGAQYFGKGGHSSAVLETDQTLGDEAKSRFVENWKKRGNHGTPLLEAGIKYRSIDIPPDDAQFLSTREFSVQDISRIFNVPPPLLYDLSRATFSNIEAQNLQFLTYSMRPLVQRIETEIEWKLLNEEDYGRVEVRFNMNDLLRGDTQSRTNLYASAIANTWMSPNEVRALENMNPYEGGDKYQNPNTTSNTNNDGEQ